MAKRPEHVFQERVVAYLARALPEGAEVLGIESSADGARDYVKIARAKRGIRAGTADVYAVWPPGRSAWWELKVRKGLTTPQEKFASDMKRCGIACHGPCRTLREIEETLVRMGLAPRMTAEAWEGIENLNAGRRGKRSGGVMRERPTLRRVRKVERVRTKVLF